MLTLSNRWFRGFESITDILDCLHCVRIFICRSNITLKIPQSYLVLFYYRFKKKKKKTFYEEENGLRSLIRCVLIVRIGV